MSTLKTLAKSTAPYAKKLRQRIKHESKQLHTVLRTVNDMKLNPSTPVPQVKFMPIFGLWLLRLTTVPFGIAVSICVVGCIFNELTAPYVIRVFVEMFIYGETLAAMFSFIIAGTAQILEGEQMAHDDYLSRVQHDYENALKLVEFSEGVLNQAAALIKRQLDYLSYTRLFFLSFIGGTGALIVAFLHALKVPESSTWYSDAAGFSALGGLLVIIGYFYAFKPLPRLRYQQSIIELAQHLEREENAEDLSPQNRGELQKKRCSLFKTAVGVISYWVIHRMQEL
jgi:hypothetical protein